MERPDARNARKKDGRRAFAGALRLALACALVALAAAAPTEDSSKRARETGVPRRRRATLSGRRRNERALDGRLDAPSSSSPSSKSKSGKAWHWSKALKASKSKSSDGGTRGSHGGAAGDGSGGRPSLPFNPPQPQPQPAPEPQPQPQPQPPRNDDMTMTNCIDTALYYEIDAGVASIASAIDNDVDRSHFFGGVLRLAAHDFMDYDRNAPDDPMGADGCLDWLSPSNAGLSSIWNEHSELHKLYGGRFSGRVSRADFWVAAANAVVRQTSQGRLDLVGTFRWGREDRDACPGSADRLPTTEGCREVEGVFLDRMGLTWGDAVALLGAHTLGRGHREFSGHAGTWVPNDRLAQSFDKRYYRELVGRSWSPRTSTEDPRKRDFTTGDPRSGRPKMMLRTDVCLFYDVEEEDACCTRTDLFDGRGVSHCQKERDRQCPMYRADHPRREATEAVIHYLGAPDIDDDNGNFYEAFRVAWFKATMNGMHDLKPVVDKC